MFSVAENFYRYLDARKKGLVHIQLDLKSFPQKPLDAAQETAFLSKYSPQLLEAYRDRVQKLIKTCRDNGIEPVFLTQPALYGFGLTFAPARIWAP